MLQPALGIAINVSGDNHLFDTVDTSGKPHTSDYLVEVFKTYVEKVESDWGVTVNALVTDNASNMASFRRHVKEPSSLLHTYGCQAHHLNLLAKDVSSIVKTPVDTIISILKQLRNHHAESSLMRDNNLPRPPLPV